MNIYQEMEALFGKENVIYPDHTKILRLDINDNLKNKIIRTGLPKKFERLNFTMDFDSTLKDEKISSFSDNPGQIYTIGFENLGNLIGVSIFPSSIGLDDNTSLAEIRSGLQDLHASHSPNIDISMLDHFEHWFLPVFDFNKRFCINFARNGEIITIDPSTLSSTFVNSDLNKLVQTFSTIQKIRNSYIDTYTANCLTPSILKRMDNDMINTVREVDPPALKDENCRWYLYFEEAVWETERLEAYEKMQLE
jgi:hypothetical protein